MVNMRWHREDGSWATKSQSGMFFSCLGLIFLAQLTVRFYWLGGGSRRSLRSCRRPGHLILHFTIFRSFVWELHCRPPAPGSRGRSELPLERAMGRGVAALPEGKAVGHCQ